MGTIILEGPYRKATNPPPASLVILLHGWGANGQDLLPLAELWADAVPRAGFVLPNGPEPHPTPGGRQWFGLRLDGEVRGHDFSVGLHMAAQAVNGFANEELARLGLPGNAVAFAGFSQGGAVALAAGLAREVGCAAVLSYSGVHSPGFSLPTGASPPPILMVHGEMDDVVPPAASDAAAAMLTAAGVSVSTHRIPALGHAIDGNCIALGAAFLVEHLSVE